MEARRQLAIAAALVALAGLVQFGVLIGAVLPALDAVRYIDTARTFADGGWQAGLAAADGRPLFPWLVYVAHEGLAPWLASRPDAWVLCAQLTAAAAVILAVLPVYFTARYLVGEGAAVAGGIFFCLLPPLAQLGADAIADSTHLLFLALTLWALVAMFARPWAAHSLRWVLLAGVAAGLAMLARSEVIVVLPAFVLALLTCRLIESARARLAAAGIAAVCFLLGAALVIGPFLLAGGEVAGIGLPSTPGSDEATHEQRSEPTTTGLAAAGMEFPVKETSVTSRQRGYAAALRALSKRLPQAFHYWVGLFALYGGWLAWSARHRPSDRFAQCFLALYLVAALQYAAMAGYLATRHLAPLVLLGSAWAGLGAFEAGRTIAGRAMRLGLRAVSEGPAPSSHRGPLAWSCVALAAMACLPRTWAPAHASHVGHREAAAWLRGAGSSDDALVLDTRGWTGLYSGLRTCRFDAARDALAETALEYVVVEQHELHYDSPRSRTLNRLLRAGGSLAGSFGAPDAGPRDTVLLYRWDRVRFVANLTNERVNQGILLQSARLMSPADQREAGKPAMAAKRRAHLPRGEE